MFCSIKSLCYLAFCRIAVYFYWSKAVAFLMHYRISHHIHRRRMHRKRGKRTPISSFHIPSGGTLKLRIVFQFQKIYIHTHTHIHRTANRFISFPAKTNDKRYQSSYASTLVAVQFAHRWEHVTIPRDNIVREAGHKLQHYWTKATWLTYESPKQNWTQARLISILQPGSEPIRVLESDPAVFWELKWERWECILQNLVLREVTYQLREEEIAV